MKPIRYVFPGLCSMALVSGPTLNAVAAGASDESWRVVPEATLSELRGGLDLGPLIGSFAIQRVIEVDGQVVARMQIVISNLNRLGQGGMPTIAISGPLAELVQVFNPAGVSASAWLPTNSSSAVGTAPAGSVAPASASANSAAMAAANNGPHIGSTSGNSGTTASTGIQTGSSAQFGAAISQAVALANGGGSANAAAPASASQSLAAPVAATSAAAATAASASTPLAATIAAASTAATTAAPAAAASPALSSTQSIPVGNTGAVIVVSNIPNAAAITSEVQNSVQATRVQTLTTITATLNSLQLLSAADIANAVRQQIASGH